MMITTDSEREPLYSTIGTDPDLGEIVTLFVEEMPDRVAALRHQFADQEWESLRQMAHQIKGAAGSYGFEQISPCAARLEYALRDGEPEEAVQRMLEELIVLCRCARAGAPKD